jgi:hypothetical protein
LIRAGRYYWSILGQYYLFVIPLDPVIKSQEEYEKINTDNLRLGWRFIKKGLKNVSPSI